MSLYTRFKGPTSKIREALGISEPEKGSLSHVTALTVFHVLHNTHKPSILACIIAAASFTLSTSLDAVPTSPSATASAQKDLRLPVVREPVVPLWSRS